MPSDFELVDAWRDGDQDAGNTLVERHFNAVYAFFRTKLDREVDDLVQGTFVACVEARDDFRKLSSFRTYLFCIARNHLRQYLRRSLRHEIIDLGASSMADLGPTPSELAHERGQRRRLLRAMRQIPLDHQIALELFYWEGLSGAELGRVLEIPEGTVRTRLRAARHNLTARLEAMTPGVGSSAPSEADLARWVRSMQQQVEAGVEDDGSAVAPE